MIYLGNGRAFVIEAFGADAEHRYVASAELNGKPLDRARVRHVDIAQGVRLCCTCPLRPELGRAVILHLRWM